MSDWFDPVVYREQAVAELLLKPQKVPHRRHFQPEVDPYSYTELLREPLPGVAAPKAASDFRVRKLCLGFWRRVEQPEIHLLRLAADQDLDGVAQLLGQEFVTAPNDRKAEAFYMAYRGLDLEQWHSVFRKETPAHFHPLGEAAFWLRLVHNILDRVLYPFHAEGFVHCDFKPDNLCIPFSEVDLEGDDVTGYLDLSRVSLIDLGAAIGPVDVEMGGRPHTGIVVEAQDDSHPRRYVSDFYSQYREHELLAIDGRADLYSFAYWLRDLLLDCASGKGPWSDARLRGGIDGSNTQCAALRELPGAIWSAADTYGGNGTLPHPGLMARIRHAETRGRDRFKFRVPFELSSADRHLVPTWSVLKGYRQDAQCISSGRKLALSDMRYTESASHSELPPTGIQPRREPVARGGGMAPPTVPASAVSPKEHDAIATEPSAPTSSNMPSVREKPQLAVPPPLPSNRHAASTIHANAINPREYDAIATEPSAPTPSNMPPVGEKQQSAVPPPLPSNQHIASRVPSAVPASASEGKPRAVWLVFGGVMLAMLAGLAIFVIFAFDIVQQESVKNSMPLGEVDSSSSESVDGMAAAQDAAAAAEEAAMAAAEAERIRQEEIARQEEQKRLEEQRAAEEENRRAEERQKVIDSAVASLEARSLRSLQCVSQWGQVKNVEIIDHQVVEEEQKIKLSGRYIMDFDGFTKPGVFDAAGDFEGQLVELKWREGSREEYVQSSCL